MLISLFNQGDLISPTFANEQVYLFSYIPDLTNSEQKSDPIGPMWKKNTLAVIVSIESNKRWAKILLDSGKTGWIGIWNIEKVK